MKIFNKYQYTRVIRGVLVLKKYHETNYHESNIELMYQLGDYVHTIESNQRYVSFYVYFNNAKVPEDELMHVETENELCDQYCLYFNFRNHLN